MNISSTGLNLIKQWEGCHLEAYRDPVGIPTIGYGAIAYPDGRTVALGDQITQEQAEGMLLHECASICPRIEQLVSVPLTQNQFDALVSFAFNVGVGALAESTLLRQLNQSDFAGAASEFLRWNKGNVNGQMVVLQGLSNRRKDECALFQSTAAPGQPIELNTTPSPQQQVTWLEVYPNNSKTVIVGWKESTIIEIISFESKSKRLLIDILNQYPAASNVLVAPPGKAIPAGTRIVITDRKGVPSSEERPIKAPPVPSQLLARGSQGQDVKTLQDRLLDLGYYKAEIDGDFGSATDAAVRSFQSDVFGPAEADGKVGPKTWAKLWQGSTGLPTGSLAGVAGKTYLRLTKSNSRDQDGLYILNLDYIKNGSLAGHLQVCSGGPSRQVFRTGAESLNGSFEPLPEGRWTINDIAWCAGRDIYGPQVFASGLGPVSTPLDYVGPGITRRGAIEIHIDWNKSGSPGTAGCIGINTISDYKTLVRWLRDSDPRDLFVDWGLGTCPQP